MLGLTQSIAREQGPKGITANAVTPGFFETDMTSVLPDLVKESILGLTAFQRFGRPEDVAELVASLASDEAGFIIGQSICIDGGMTMC